MRRSPRKYLVAAIAVTKANVYAKRCAASLMLALVAMCAACGGGGSTSATTPSTNTTVSNDPTVTATAPVHRSGYLGAFFRTDGTPPYGVFLAGVKDVAPSPYPTPGMTGVTGYCTSVASNGVSIMTGYPVDPQKLAHIVGLGVKWTRSGPDEFFDDDTHISGGYTFADFDSAQCSLVQSGITPFINIAAGPVEYNSTPGQFSPQSQAIYKSASDFGQWCSAVATHETQAFPSVRLYSVPGNEVDSNPANFPGGNTQIAQYSEACYAAIKAAQPQAFVYGFELNMDPTAHPIAFVQQMVALGCKVGTCYDGLSIHLSLTYPIPSSNTPCIPLASMQCVSDIQAAAGAPVHVIIGETGYSVPGAVPNQATQASAIVAEMETFANYSSVDGALYDDVDECALYPPPGYFSNGCLINTSGVPLPAYNALAALANADYQ